MARLAALAVALAMPLAATAGTARVLLTTTAVGGLAADGATALVATTWASGSCERVLSWNPVRPTLRGFGSGSCPAASTGRAILDLELAAGRAAWIRDVGGNQRQASLYVAPISRPRAVRRVALARRDADSQDGDYVGNLAGDAKLLFYNTWSVCQAGDVSLKPCPVGVHPGTIFGQTLWAIDRAGTRRRLASSPGELAVLDAAGGRVLLQRADGAL